MKKYGFVFIMAVAMAALIFMYQIVDAAEVEKTGSKYEPFIVESTGYDNPNGNLTATQTETIEGITIAAKEEWFGCVIALYEIAEGGGIGDFIGYRQVTDTGYGHDSKLYKGMGTIQTGETVDIYFESYDDAMQWGSKQVYIQVIPGKG